MSTNTFISVIVEAFYYYYFFLWISALSCKCVGCHSECVMGSNCCLLIASIDHTYLAPTRGFSPPSWKQAKTTIDKPGAPRG